MQSLTWTNKLGLGTTVVIDDANDYIAKNQKTLGFAGGTIPAELLAYYGYTRADVIDDLVINGKPFCNVPANYTITVKDISEQELYDLYTSIRSKVLSAEYDIFRTPCDYLDVDAVNINIVNSDNLRSCRGTKSAHFVKSASFFIDWDLGAKKDNFPTWMQPIKISYRKYDDAGKTIFSKYAKVDTATNKIIVDDKFIDLWQPLKTLWVSYANVLQSKRAIKGGGKDGVPQSY